jgi:hypothetical protein
MKSGITFSTDTKEILKEDLGNILRIAKREFETDTDKDQIQPQGAYKDPIWKRNPNALNIIKEGKKFVGYTYLIPTSKELMNRFLKRGITERELRDITIKQNPDVEAIYLCAAYIEPEYRNNGLAKKAAIKSIRAISKGMKNKPYLFFWGYSKEGEKSAKGIANEIKFQLKKLKN